MIMRLQNLFARVLNITDAGAVVKLFQLEGESLLTEDELIRTWSKSGFQLAQDAWVLVSHVDGLVGYVAVHEADKATYWLDVIVHPAYRQRGLGTLLVRFAEERTRQLMAQNGQREGILQTLMQRENRSGCLLMEREDFQMVREVWRMSLKQEKENNDASADLDLWLELEHLRGLTEGAQTGFYEIRAYVLYERCLSTPLLMSIEPTCETVALIS